MAPPRIKTIQAKFGFADPDLQKPVHDQMIKWIEANVEDILMQIFSLPARPKRVKTKWEPLVQMAQTKWNTGQFIGFIDFMATPYDEIKYDGMQISTIVFEAKTSIDSLGELFRQTNMYKAGYIAGAAVAGMPFVIVSPDDANAEIIREQKLLFLKYEPNRVFTMGGV
jgi:hypothetical protein